MKKILTLLMLGGVAFAANAQQINGEFFCMMRSMIPFTGHVT